MLLAKTWGPDFKTRIGNEAFRVHSVFRAVCNLQADLNSPLLSLVAKEEARGSNSLWIEQLAFVDYFEVGMPIHLDRDSLFCGQVVIDCSSSLLHRPRIENYEQDQSVWYQVEAWLESQNPGFTRTKSKLTEKLEQGLLEEDRDSFLAAMQGLIGSGEGLTPAGDDFVAGVLTAYVRACRTVRSNGLFLDEITPDLTQILRRTNSISQTMLLYSLKGEGALYVTELIDAIYTGNQNALNYALRLWQVGASSGRHLLAGILLGCKIFWTREKDDGREN